MNIRIILATLVAAALPAAAQTDTAKLEKGQAKVQKMEDKTKSGSQMTRKERAQLAKAQDKQARKTYREKHDKQKQAPAT